MTTATFLRKDLGLDLASLRAELDAETSATQIQEVALGQVEFDLTGQTPSVNFGAHSVPATEGTLNAFADFLSVPKPFLKRLGQGNTAVQQAVMRAMVETAQQSAVAVRFGEGGVSGVFEPGKTPLDPARLVGVAQSVLGDRGVVQRRVNTGADFGFDVHVPFDSARGVSGSGEVEAPEALANYSWTSHLAIAPGAKVRDITAGGLRFGVDLKHGLTPWVQPYMLRLACTNGMETTDPGLKIDGRGQTIDEVMASLEEQAERAFSAVEAQIEHFYRLREQPVANPERALVRIAAERGLPQRSLQALLAAAPSEALPDSPTMFDLTNLVTNLANSPSIINDGGRLLLERAGGGIVNDEATRCGHCQQKV